MKITGKLKGELDILGCFGEPYWEIYPHERDIFRCRMQDVDILLTEIGKSLDEQ